MKILYIGDVMAGPGLRLVSDMLPDVIAEFTPDFVIAQAENSNPEGKGPGRDEIETMQAAGVDFFTGGNHSLTGPGSAELYADPSAPIIRPANLIGAEGDGWRVVETAAGKILVASILGQTVGKQLETLNPLEVMDSILKKTETENFAARIVNFHGDYSSEKRVFGYYLDGRVTAVIGDHWHVPTADAIVMPHGTAHITDVGMCGSLHSSLGVKTDVIVERWLTSTGSKNQIEESGPLQFNAVLVEADTSTGLSKSIVPIQRIIDQKS